MATALLLAGNFHLARFVSGSNVGYWGPINLTTLKITQPDPDNIQQTSRMRDSFGQALNSYPKPKPAEIEATTDETSSDILAMGMLGTPATYTQAAGSGQALSFTARHDKWVSVGKNNLSAFAIAGKTENTDYIIDLPSGLCMVLSTGTITEASTVNSTASWSARSGYKISAGTVSLLQLGIRGSGINLFNSKQFELDLWQANVTPSGGLSFISESDPVSITLKGTIILPTGKTGLYDYTEHS